MSSNNPRHGHARIRRNLFFILVALTTVGFMGMIAPFLLTILWAVVLAIIFNGTNRWFRYRFKGKRDGLAATITTLLVLLFVIVPFILISIALYNQGASLFDQLSSGELDPNVIPNYIEENLPSVTSRLSEFGIEVDDLRARIQEVVVQGGQIIANSALSIGSNILNVLIQFTLVLYLLFFFLRDGKQIVQAILNTVPMGNIREKALLNRFALVSRATLKGTLVVALVQGAIGGILFAAVGIPGYLLWGVAMTLLALLPVGGSAIVWLPAAVILAIQGEVVEAVIILAVGSLIIGLVDNLLRPLLVGRDTQMPDYLVLISTLGGIAMFGLSGFVVGPTIAALFVTVWQMMGREYGGTRS